MKKCLLIALLSANAAANTNHLYVGSDLLVGHYTDIASLQESNELGASAFVGYNFAINPNFDLGVELEYQHFGKAEYLENVSAEGNAFYINARPKFMDKNSNLYSALIFGVGSLESEINVLGMSASDSEISYQAGLEIGYMFNDIDFSIGYRYRSADFDGVDIKIKGFTAGMRYNF